MQVFEDNEEQTFKGIDLLDPTKLVPEEDAPVQAIGLMTLTANPSNYFAETEQVAFHVGNLVPGIDVTDDPLLQARLFSYVDTQLTRLGGPNFNQIPINRPHAPVNDMLRDGFHQHAVHAGVAPYRPNSLDGGCPFHAGAGDGAFVEAAVATAGTKTRSAPASYDDHFSQVRQFWLSMTPVEQDHIVQRLHLRAVQVLRAGDPRAPAAGAGQRRPRAVSSRGRRGSACRRPSRRCPWSTCRPRRPCRRWAVRGRPTGARSGSSSTTPPTPTTSTPGGGDPRRGPGAARRRPARRDAGQRHRVQRTFGASRSVEFDAVLVGARPAPAPDALPTVDAKGGEPTTAPIDPRVVLLLHEAFRHAKAIASWGPGMEAVADAGIPFGAAGLVADDDAGEAWSRLHELMTQHRVWDRFAPVSEPA